MSAAPRPNLEVADVFRGEAESFLRRSGKHLSIAQKRAFAAISTCRTAALGGHVVACDHCDHQRISYNSCRNRHCPKCQALTRAQWLERREAELLPIPYYVQLNDMFSRFRISLPVQALCLDNCTYSRRMSLRGDDRRRRLNSFKEARHEGPTFCIGVVGS